MIAKCLKESKYLKKDNNYIITVLYENDIAIYDDSGEIHLYPIEYFEVTKQL